MKLVLASTSPRRQQLLTRLAIPFDVVPPEHEEQLRPSETPEAGCRRLADEKAQSVAPQRPQDLVVGADTIVILGREVLGKPADLEDARRMLQSLSGQTHLVKTAVALISTDRHHHSGFVETTEVTFHRLSEDDIQRYLDIDPPLDKAGAYGIQDWSGVFVRRVVGCYHNVVGFPLAHFYRHLHATSLWGAILTRNHL